MAPRLLVGLRTTWAARTEFIKLQPLGCGFMEHHRDSVEKVRSNGGASEARR